MRAKWDEGGYEMGCERSGMIGRNGMGWDGGEMRTDGGWEED